MPGDIPSEAELPGTTYAPRCVCAALIAHTACVLCTPKPCFECGVYGNNQEDLLQPPMIQSPIMERFEEWLHSEKAIKSHLLIDKV